MGKEKLDIGTIRHSLSHILAAAVMEMFPEAKLGIGPAIETGFYYDFDLPRTLIPEDLPLIEEKMRKFIAKNLKFEKQELPIKEAEEKLKKSDEIYKAELVRDLKKTGEQKVILYKCGDFVDLCQGPHVESTADLKNIAFKLDRIAGAYWKGDEKNKMLQRIYGLAFKSKEELAKFIKNWEEAGKRDHRKLGHELGLFTFHSEAPGIPFWHDKGVTMLEILIARWRKIQKEHGYEEVRLPNLLDVGLWKRSGHFDHYKGNMFFTENEGRKMALRPMDCPGAILVYKERARSYHDLPIRWSELGTVFRNEKSGEIHGLLRVQQITQDDAHIFVEPDKIELEISDVLGIVEEIYRPFDMKREVFLSTMPDDAMGDRKIWAKAEAALKSALDKKKIKYGIKEKDGAFYGPKIDIHIDDALGRTWQTGTIQLDFFMPERFELEYVNEKGKKVCPVMIHRALMGSLERFVGIITEHYGGAFPVWLAPVQAIVLPISERHNTYAEKIVEDLRTNNIRVEIDNRNESINRKIRDAELQKIPYMLIIGDKEKESQKVSLRRYGEGDKGQIKIAELVNKINDRTC
jgi:threonyl-tRNA synthetase